MKRILRILSVLLTVLVLTACGMGIFTGQKSLFPYHFADREEAVSCYLSNEDYFEGIGPWDIQYKTGDKKGTVEELKEFGSSQMQEYSDTEKAAIEKTMKEIEEDVEKGGYSLPAIDEITFIKSTQAEESDSGAYTHGTQIYMGQDIIDLISSEDEEEYLYGKSVLWHEIFHCLTRNNPDFRADMYKLVHFTVQEEDYEIPDKVYKKYISNPDVEHHNSYATFQIRGKKIDCFTAMIATEPFEKEGDTFFECMDTALIPVDGSNTYYTPEDAENFWEVFGENTEYVTDPEECMADNFSFAMTYGEDGMDYKNPEIIKGILDYCRSKE